MRIKTETFEFPEIDEKKFKSVSLSPQLHKFSLALNFILGHIFAVSFIGFGVDRQKNGSTNFRFASTFIISFSIFHSSGERLIELTVVLASIAGDRLYLFSFHFVILFSSLFCCWSFIRFLFTCHKLTIALLIFQHRVKIMQNALLMTRHFHLYFVPVFYRRWFLWSTNTDKNEQRKFCVHFRSFSCNQIIICHPFFSRQFHKILFHI